MKTILAIDPGTEQSGLVRWDGTLIQASILPNKTLLDSLKYRLYEADICAIEMVASYGMAVGKEVFETVLWIGRFIERAEPIPVRLVYRRDIKVHLCNSVKAKDANIRQALIDKHGAPGTKKNPGKTYGIKSHLWAALALADYGMTHFLTEEKEYK